MSKIIFDTDMQYLERVVYMAMAEEAVRWRWTGVQRALAERIGAGASAVSRAIKALVEKQYLKPHRLGGYRLLR